ncbi:MAG: RNA polymerase sporulation sigma factor SigK [Eubacteriales bacterium]
MGIFRMLAGLVCLFLRVEEQGSFPPPLSPEMEREYFRRARTGDEKAREELILHNMRLVAHIVKKYYTGYGAQDDLISIGTIGLIKAIDSFNVDNGTRFATYAGKCLQNEILMYFRSQKKTLGDVSLSETIDVDKDGNPLTWSDVLAVEDTIADDLFIKISSEKARQIISEHLSEREQTIIRLRYGLDGREPLTQREIAGRLGISRSYVSRIEKSALEKIGCGLSGKPIPEIGA